MKKICEKCGKEFTVYPGVLSLSKQKYCDKCGFKYTLPTQKELAKRAGREFDDKVQQESDIADTEGVSYGVHMARKVEK